MLDKVAEKTNLITFDSDAPKSKRLLYIGTNNYEAGKVLGGRDRQAPARRAARSRCSSGRFAADNAAQRLKGIEDAIAGHNIEIVDKREDNTDRAKARSNVEDIVNAHHDLTMVVGLYNYNGPAIAAALDGARQEGQGPRRRVRRGRRHARRDRERRHPGARSCRSRSMFGYLASQVDARARHQGRGGQGRAARRPRSSTPAST